MKTTVEGLTHLINMLVDVVQLQRKAEGTPGATCDVDILFEESGRVTVELVAVVDVSANPKPPTIAEMANSVAALKAQEAPEAPFFPREAS